LLTRYGLSASPLGEAEREYFKVDKGLLATQVWQGHPADLAGLEPGDLIIELDGRPVNAPEDLHALVMPVARETFDLTVRRWGSKVALKLPVRVSPSQAGSDSALEAGVVMAATPRGLRIDAVIPGSPAQKASIRAGDRLLEVDGRTPANTTQVQAALGSTNPRFLVLEKGRKRWGVLLSP
jgi:serine protease Do